MLQLPTISRRSLLIQLSAAAAGSALAKSAFSNDSARPFTIVVMDPLAAPLACDCVKGYAQRKYEKLGEYLSKQIGRDVNVVWNGSLLEAIKGDASGGADLVVGKDSVVRTDAKNGKLSLEPVASLSGLDGSTEQTGVFVVRAKDPAATVLDLEGYSIFFGPDEAEEKSTVPKQTLDELEIKYSSAETCPSCSEAAKKLLALPTDAKSAAVISSYATPLLEGCGTIQKGDLKIVGKSDPVPFITAFVRSDLDPAEREKVVNALLGMEDPELRKSLETKHGFVAYKDSRKKA